MLDAFEAHGYSGQFRALPEGRIECVNCSAAVPASEVAVDALRRLEGASDPDDALAVLAAECRVCGTRGTLVLGYGPSASGDDTEVLEQLEAPPPPAPAEVDV